MAIETLQESGISALKQEWPTVFVKYPRGFAELAVKAPRSRDDAKPFVHWLYGKSGGGKTRYVVELEEDLWVSGSTLKWWNGYYDQEAVLFDDFRGDFCTYHWLLRILDRYPIAVEVKGGMVQFTARRIYITCPSHPRDVYITVEDKHQLLRRIDRITHVTGDAFVEMMDNI